MSRASLCSHQALLQGIFWQLDQPGRWKCLCVLSSVVTAVGKMLHLVNGLISQVPWMEPSDSAAPQCLCTKFEPPDPVRGPKSFFVPSLLQISGEQSTHGLAGLYVCAFVKLADSVRRVLWFRNGFYAHAGICMIQTSQQSHRTRLWAWLHFATCLLPTLLFFGWCEQIYVQHNCDIDSAKRILGAEQSCYPVSMENRLILIYVCKGPIRVSHHWGCFWLGFSRSLLVCFSCLCPFFWRPCR
jgi:hypothetical protein